MQDKLTFVVFTFNEEDRLPWVIKNFSGFARILVVDNESTDRTIEIAKAAGCDVLINKNKGWVEDEVTAARVKKAVTTQWIYWGFADELLDEQSFFAIRDAIQSGKYNIINIARKNYYYGRFCNEAYANRLNRIFQKDALDFNGNTIHNFGKVLVSEKEICYLDKKQYYVRHFVSNDAKSYLKSINGYTDIESARSNGTRTILALLLKLFREFLINYFIKGAYRAGVPGFFLVLQMMYYDCLLHMKIFEREEGVCVAEIEALNNIERDTIFKSFGRKATNIN